MSLHIAYLRPAAGMWDIIDIVDGDPDGTGATIDDWIETWRANGWTVEPDDSPRMVSDWSGTYLRVREYSDHPWQYIYVWEEGMVHVVLYHDDIASARGGGGGSGHVITVKQED